MTSLPHPVAGQVRTRNNEVRYNVIVLELIVMVKICAIKHSMREAVLRYTIIVIWAIDIHAMLKTMVIYCGLHCNIHADLSNATESFL